METRDALFYGLYSAKVDLKSRFAIPAAIRQALPSHDNVYLLPLSDGALYVGGLSALFNSNAQQHLDQIAPYIVPMPKLEQKAGRLLIPLATRVFAGLDQEKTLIVSGHGHYFAIRSPKNWEEVSKISRPIIHQTRK